MKTDPHDEEALLEAAREQCAAPNLRDVLKREYNERLKGRPRDVALEKWGSEIEMEILGDLENSPDATSL